MFSDIDEIPNAKDVIKHSSFDGLTTFLPYLYYYYLNCKGQLMGSGTNMVPYRLIKKFNLKPQALRDSPSPIPSQGLNSGWHFAYTGGADKIIDKIEASAHTCYNIFQFKDKEHIIECMEKGQDIYKRKSVTFEFVPIDDSFPIWVQNNQDKLSHLIKEL